jgi:hypothetical protein
LAAGLATSSAPSATAPTSTTLRLFFNVRSFPAPPSGAEAYEIGPPALLSCDRRPARGHVRHVGGTCPRPPV